MGVSGLTFEESLNLGARVTFNVPTGHGYRIMIKLGGLSTVGPDTPLTPDTALYSGTLDPPVSPTDPDWDQVANTTSGSGTFRDVSIALPTNDEEYGLAVYSYDPGGATFSASPAMIYVFGMVPPLAVHATQEYAIFEIVTARRAAMVLELGDTNDFPKGSGDIVMSQRADPSNFMIYPPGTPTADILAGDGDLLSADGWLQDSDGSLVRCSFTPTGGTRYARAYQESTFFHT